MPGVWGLQSTVHVIHYLEATGAHIRHAACMNPFKPGLQSENVHRLAVKLPTWVLDMSSRADSKTSLMGMCSMRAFSHSTWAQSVGNEFEMRPGGASPSRCQL